MSMFAFMSLIIIAFQWWRDILREASMEGMHSKKAIKGIKMGMMLFIASEVMFFFSFFWAFWHSAYSPNIEIGIQWPPKNIEAFNPMNIPLMNTLILISSGMTITWSHHTLMSNKKMNSNLSLIMTIILAIYFTTLQGMEYWQSSFSMNDSIYGSIFFMATGFHGIHVMIGTIFLIVNLIQKKMSPSINHFISFELAAWYWHFVDIVWLMLYTCIYWWSL